MKVLKKMPKAIGITFDSNKGALTVLCEDGSIWQYLAFENKEGNGELFFNWIQIDNFKGE